jgi:sucrose-6F-phosphate phosphohydrolase
VYATGRHRDSLQRLIAVTALPTPDAAITNVGTEIHDGSGLRWPGWAERFDGFDAEVVRQTLRRFRWLKLQPDDTQTGLKASYDVRGVTEPQIEEIHGALERAGLGARIIYSSALHLDILPAGAGKGAAAGFLAASWGLPRNSVLAFGDTGNDLDLFRSGFLGTVVGNALPELVDAIGGDVYRSPLSYAAGVLDGIRHWAEAGAAMDVPRRERGRSAPGRVATRHSTRTP